MAEMAEQWILDVTEELLRPHDPLDQELYVRSIYRVPKILTDINSQAYKPKVASFGPYHHDCLHLSFMEPHKRRAVIHFLPGIAKASKTPEDVYVAMRNVESRLLAHYDNLHMEHEEQDCLERSRFRHRDWCKEKDEYLKLMIVDGCFALEVMLAEKRSAAGEQSEYNPQDRLFGEERKNCEIPYLKQDMLLLENQIPFLALTTLAAIDGSGDSLLALNTLREEVDLEKKRTKLDKPEHQKDFEACVRAKNNAWVIAKISRGRELYMALEKASETLLFASEAVEKFSNRYCEGAFSLD